MVVSGTVADRLGGDSTPDYLPLWPVGRQQRGWVGRTQPKRRTRGENGAWSLLDHSPSVCSVYISVSVIDVRLVGTRIYAPRFTSGSTSTCAVHRGKRNKNTRTCTALPRRKKKKIILSKYQAFPGKPTHTRIKFTVPW